MKSDRIILVMRSLVSCSKSRLFHNAIEKGIDTLSIAGIPVTFSLFNDSEKKDRVITVKFLECISANIYFDNKVMRPYCDVKVTIDNNILKQMRYDILSETLV